MGEVTSLSSRGANALAFLGMWVAAKHLSPPPKDNAPPHGLTIRYEVSSSIHCLWPGLHHHPEHCFTLEYVLR